MSRIQCHGLENANGVTLLSAPNGQKMSTTKTPEKPASDTSILDALPTPQSQGKRKLEDVDQVERPTKVQQTYVKHDTHWYLDGNVLLQFGNTRFKLHRGRLARESEWFQALFDHRAGGRNDFQYRDEIDPLIETMEQVDDKDLFYCDTTGVTCEQFAVLLDAMEGGV